MVERYGRHGHLIAETPWRFTVSMDPASQWKTRKRWTATIEQKEHGFWTITITAPTTKLHSFLVVDTDEKQAKRIATRMLRKAAP